MDVTVICPECGEQIEAANQGIALADGTIVHLDCIEDEA